MVTKRKVITAAPKRKSVTAPKKPTPTKQSLKASQPRILTAAGWKRKFLAQKKPASKKT